MNKIELILQYSKQDKKKQIIILSFMSYQITIFARGIKYEENSDFAIQLSSCLNEILHKILGQQYSLLSNDDNKYPDELFMKGLFHRAKYSSKFEKYFIECFEKSLNL